MCQRAFYITNGLQQVEQNVLTHPKVKNGRYFGTSVVRLATRRTVRGMVLSVAQIRVGHSGRILT